MARTSLLLLLAFVSVQKREVQRNTIDFAEDEYDFIIVGGGTTGLTVASRLSEISSLKILVLEAGDSDLLHPEIHNTRDWTKNLGSSIDWNYEIVPQQQINGVVSNRKEFWARGKILGGSSAINAMLYSRGSPHDYDSWEEHGATGWAWKDLEPYFRKLEGADPGMSKNMGRDGRLKLTRRYSTPMHKLLLQTGEKLGYKNVNYNEELEGISDITSSIYQGLRQTSSNAYIYGILPERRQKLHVVVNAYVTKVVLNKSNESVPTATGINYMKNGESRFVRARKEVIVSAGAIETPHLLMLSGIGARAHLEDMKIPVMVDLRGVGSNLQDHPMAFQFYHASNMPKDLVTTPEMLSKTLNEYTMHGTGPWTAPLSHDTHMHVRTDRVDKSDRRYKVPHLQFIFISAANDSAFTPPQDPNNAKWVSFSIAIALMHPKSVGYVRLKSNDPNDYPEINPRYFAEEEDLNMFVEGARRLEEFEKSELFQKLGAKMIMISLCNEYHKTDPPRNEELYKCLFQAGVFSESHACCTAKMGQAEDETSVVDSRLRVHGVRGLRVADASVMPHLTSSNIQAPSYVIGEKGADMIKEDWNL